MKALVNTISAALSLGLIAAPIAAQTATCDPTANTKGDIAKAQFSLTRAVAQEIMLDPDRLGNGLLL